MKLSLTPILLCVVLLLFAACKTQHAAIQNPATPNSPPVKLDLSSGTTVDYGPLTNGYAHSNDVFMVEVSGYNPLKYRIAGTTTGLVTFQNSSNAVLTYTTIAAPGASTPSTPAAGGTPPPQLVANDISKLRLIVRRITTATPRANKDMDAISQFLNSLAGYQNTIENVWKPLEQLQSSTVQTEQQKIYNRLGDQINDYFDQAPVNPFQPTLGTSPNCKIDYYMITDFPTNVNKDLTNQINEYKLALEDLTAFETAHAAQIKEYYKQVGINDPEVFKSDVNKSISNVQTFQNDFTSVQQPKLTPFANLVTTVSTLQYSTLIGPFSLQQNDEITIKVSKTNLATNNDALATFLGVVIKRKGGVKIDFSAGLFFSGLSDRSYVSSQSSRITQDSTIDNGSVVVKPNQTTFSTIKRRNGANFSYGPMAFMHFHSMTAGPVNYGAFLGTGFMFKDNAKPILAFGANFMFSNFQRVVFGIGGSFGSVTRLSSKYQEDGTYRETITDVPTESRMDFKGMFSVSWNLSK